MVNAKYSLINTTVGKKWLVITNCQSKMFKTEKGCLNWINKKGYKATRV